MVTATIQPNSRRDVTTGDPKVLLLDVYLDGELFRDHLWVSEEKFKHLRKQCKHNASQLQVQFKAKVREYRTVGPTKLGLIAIKDVTALN